MQASRLRRHLATIFDVFTEVAAPTSDGGKPWRIWQYPEDFDDKQKLHCITEFAYPCGASTAGQEAVQLFSFVLTDVSSQYTFGFCRHTPKSNTCLCILSGLPWTNFFYKLLNHFASVMNNGTGEELEALLVRAYHQEVPRPGETFCVESSLGRNKLESYCPDHTKLPTIQDNRNLMDYYSCVNEKHMMAVFASLLRERRVVFTSQKLGQLTHCVLAAQLLICPFFWQHIFVPVLPQHLFHYLNAPMPFLVGVPTSSMQVRTKKARHEVDLSEVVILDLDNKTFTSPFADLAELPHDVTWTLKRNLRSSNHLLGDGLARSFLRAMVVFLGGYRRGFVRPTPQDPIRFDTDRFIAEQKSSLRQYLNEMRASQIFQQFVDERVSALNAGEPIRDEFEEEVRVCENTRTKTRRDLMREKGIEAFSGFQERVSKFAKEAPSSLRGPGLPSPPAGRPPNLQKSLDFATSYVKESLPRVLQKQASAKKLEQDFTKLSFENRSESERKLSPEFENWDMDLLTPEFKAMIENSSARLSANSHEQQLSRSMTDLLGEESRRDDPFHVSHSAANLLTKDPVSGARQSPSVKDLIDLEEEELDPLVEKQRQKPELLPRRTEPGATPERPPKPSQFQAPTPPSNMELLETLLKTSSSNPDFVLDDTPVPLSATKSWEKFE